MEVLTVNVMEAARVLSIGRTLTYDLINRGVLKSHSLGRRRLVSVESIHHLLQRQD